MKITEALQAEHLVFHQLFDFIEVAAPRMKTLPELRALAALMEKMLHAHSQTEDELFIGALDPAFDQIGQCDTFHHEHELIDRNLALAQKAREVTRARKLLLSAVTLSRSHIDKEERIVFPMAEKLLKRKTLRELGRTWVNQRNSVIK